MRKGFANSKVSQAGIWKGLAISEATPTPTEIGIAPSKKFPIMAEGSEAIFHLSHIDSSPNPKNPWRKRTVSGYGEGTNIHEERKCRTLTDV